IAITPHVWTSAVRVVTIAIGIASQIEPAAPPALAVMRRSQEPVYQLLIRLGGSVGNESLYFPRRRDQSPGVECGAPNERRAVCIRRRFDVVCLQPREHERVYGSAHPVLVMDLRHRLALDGLVRPPLRRGRTSRPGAPNCS